jgi:tetratricopeptide (TPR) repeat protein
MAELLREARKGAVDSPLFSLLEGYPDIAHDKTDVFREQVEYSQTLKERLRTLRAIKPLAAAAQALRELEASVGAIADVESGVLIDLFLSYREVEAWQDMLGLAGRMPRALAATVLVREQLALALNRAGRGDEAEQVLLELLRARGPGSETYGILGRVYKDRFTTASRAGNKSLAGGFLKKAVEAYLKGFESDFRDAYPGINALTLMTIANPADPRLRELVPVVAYAVKRHMAGREPNYWDFATQIELALHAGDEAAAREALSNALATTPKAWELDTTLNNLGMLWGARADAGRKQPWEEDIEQDLRQGIEEARGKSGGET